MAHSLVEADAGDFHFELHRTPNGQFECVRSLVDDPVHTPEVLGEIDELPKQVQTIFSHAMCSASK